MNRLSRPHSQSTCAILADQTCLDLSSCGSPAAIAAEYAGSSANVLIACAYRLHASVSSSHWCKRGEPLTLSIHPSASIDSVMSLKNGILRTSAILHFSSQSLPHASACLPPPSCCERHTRWHRRRYRSRPRWSPIRHTERQADTTLSHHAHYSQSHTHVGLRLTHFNLPVLCHRLSSSSDSVPHQSHLLVSARLRTKDVPRRRASLASTAASPHPYLARCSSTPYSSWRTPKAKEIAAGGQSRERSSPYRSTL